MNLEGIRKRLEDLYGPAATNEESYYDRIINDSYKELCGITEWWFLEKQHVITTTGYARTVEVEATNGSATLSPASSALWVDDYDEGYLATGNHIYRILEANNSVGDIILDSEWIEATDADASVNIWKDTFALPSDYDAFISLIPRSFPGKKPVRLVDPIEIEAETYEIFRQSTEHATKCCILKEKLSASDTSAYKLRIFPPPDEEVEYYLRYIALPDDLEDSTDESLLPEKHHGILAAMAKLRLLKDRREDPADVQNAEIEAQKGLQRLWKAQVRAKGTSRKFGRRGTTKARYMPYKPVNVTSESP